MSTQIEEPWWSRNKWILPVILGLIIVGVVVGVLLASHMHHTAAHKHRATPTPTSTPTPRPHRTPTATPTPVHRASPTPSPSPTATPTPTPSPTPVPTVNGHKLGVINHSSTRVQDLQRAATNHQKGFTLYLNPLMVVQYTLQSYGFTGTFQVIHLAHGSGGSPTPRPRRMPAHAASRPSSSRSFTRTRPTSCLFRSRPSAGPAASGSSPRSHRAHSRQAA